MSKTTENLGEESIPKSSIRTTQAPGGRSNFSLAWDTPPSNLSKDQEKKVLSNINEEGVKKDEQIEVQQAVAVGSDKTQTPAGGKSSIVLGSDKTDWPSKEEKLPTQATEKPKTSIRVQNPPGGKSSISFY